MAVWWRKHDKEQRAALKKRAAEGPVVFSFHTLSEVLSWAITLDRKKKKEEDERREALRQQKKLNFLITQTELYSYFIGRHTPQHKTLFVLVSILIDSSSHDRKAGQEYSAPVSVQD